MSWQYSEKLIRLGLGFFISIILARELGVSGFGLYNSVIVYITLFYPLCGFGIKNIIIRELVIDLRKKNELISVSICILFIFSIIAFLLANISSPYIFHNSSEALTLVFLFSFIFILKISDVFIMLFESQLLSKYVCIPNLIGYLLFFVLVIFSLNYQIKLSSLFKFKLFEQLLISLILLVLARKYSYKLSKFKFNINLLYIILKDSWPLMLSSFAIILYMKMDVLMINYMLSTHDVGLYCAASRLSEAWFFIPVILNTSIRPYLIQSCKDNNQSLLNALRIILDFSVIFTVITSILLSFFKNKIIFSLYGIDYTLSAHVFNIQIWGGLFVFINSAIESWFIIKNEQKILFLRVVLGLLVNFCLNLLFIPNYGILGAAFATLLSKIFSSYIILFFNNKTRVLFYIITKSLFSLGFPTIQIIFKKYVKKSIK